MREHRIEEMEHYIIDHKSVSLEQLCEVFQVSINTIRRDIAEIISHGRVKKVYGGVSVYQERLPLPFEQRTSCNLDVKRAIGYTAAQLVEDSDILYIDSGTTASQMVNYLGNKKNITIVTHSLEVINRAVPYPGLNIVCLSGTLDRGAMSFSSHSMLEQISNYNISKAFMAANGITVANGATQSSSWEYEIKYAVIARSHTSILMVEHRKFGEVSLLTYCPYDGFDMIITEQEPPAEFRDAYLEQGGKILLASANVPNTGKG